MRWYKFRLKTKTDMEDLVISALSDAGVEGAEIEDKVPLTPGEQKQMFVDIPLPAGEDDGVAYLDFYLEEDEEKSPEENEMDVQRLLMRVDEELSSLRRFADIGPCPIERSMTEDIDWVNNWKKYFHQFRVDDILIIPSWEKVDPDESAKMVLHIDPGTAFGTGMHETTQLCMRALKKYVTPETDLLDVGTGSGILSIVALKLGAKHAFGTDLDPNAEYAVRDNLTANDVSPEKMDFTLGNIIDDPEVQKKAGFECYDIVTANILADVLVHLTPEVVRHMKHGGIYITSGILDVKEKDVTKAVEDAGLTVLEVDRQGEWVAVIAKRP